MTRKGIVASIIIGLVGAMMGSITTFFWMAVFSEGENAAGLIWRFAGIPGAASGFISCFSFSVLYLKMMRSRKKPVPAFEPRNWWQLRGGGTYSILAGLTSGVITSIVAVTSDAHYGAYPLGAESVIGLGDIGAVVGTLVGWGIGSLVIRLFEANDWCAENLV